MVGCAAGPGPAGRLGRKGPQRQGIPGDDAPGARRLDYGLAVAVQGSPRMAGGQRRHVSVAGHDFQAGAVRRVPHPQRLIVRPAHDPPAVGGVRHVGNGPAWPRKTASSAPLPASHTRTVSSSEPVATRAPSGEKVTAVTVASWPWSSASSAPLPASHTRAVWSYAPLASRVPSGAYARQQTLPACPRRTARSSPVMASHRRTVSSALALAMTAPLGE